MTEQEFNQFIEEQKQSGKSEEDILIIFCAMFRDGKLPRDQFEAVVEALGYELDPEWKRMPDDELKEKVLVQKEGKPSEGETIAPEGSEPPEADPEDKPEDKPEPESEPEDKPEVEEVEEEDERSKAMKLYGLKK